MINYKQVPLVRVSARKALEEKRISLDEYNLIVQRCDEVERQRLAERRLESRAAGEWVASKNRQLQAL